jgi:hypothetical protein
MKQFNSYKKPVSHPQVNPTVQFCMQRYTLEQLEQEVIRLEELSAELAAQGNENNNYWKLIPYYEAAIQLKNNLYGLDK